MKSFNLNSYVWFTPTQLGLQAYIDRWKEYKIDKKLELVDNKACLQFHEFIDVYGKWIANNYVFDDRLIEDYEILLNERDLKEVLSEHSKIMKQVELSLLDTLRQIYIEEHSFRKNQKDKIVNLKNKRDQLTKQLWELQNEN